MIEKKNTIKTIIFFSFELDINIEKPLTPGDVTYQRTEREKELKQQQQQQQLQQQQAQLQAAQAATTTNVHPQQTPTTPNSIDTIKSQTSVSNTPLTPTITTRVKFMILFFVESLVFFLISFV